MDQASEYERFEQCSTLDNFPSSSDADTWLTDVSRRSEGRAPSKKGLTPLKRRTIASQPPRILPKENSIGVVSPLSQHSSHRTLSCKKDSNRSDNIFKRSPQPALDGSVVVLSLQKNATPPLECPSDTVHFRSVLSEDRVETDDDVTFGARFAAFQSPPCESEDKRSLLYTSIEDESAEGEMPNQPAAAPPVAESPPRLCLFTKDASPQMAVEDASPPNTTTVVNPRLEPSPIAAPVDLAVIPPSDENAEPQLSRPPDDTCEILAETELPEKNIDVEDDVIAAESPLKCSETSPSPTDKAPSPSVAQEELSSGSPQKEAEPAPAPSVITTVVPPMLTAQPSREYQETKASPVPASSQISTAPAATVPAKAATAATGPAKTPTPSKSCCSVM